MHPAPSLIVFTTLSGFGFGLMIWLGLRGADPALSLLALIAAGAGLFASLAHLGNPQRAWRAVTQWRSSWLSREGVVAIAAMGVFFLIALLTYLGRPLPWLGWLAAALALVTVLCTAMIYAQLKTVPRWHTPLTPLLFVLIALTGPALVLAPAWVALGLLALTALAQWRHWQEGDAGLAALGVDAAAATGLSGQVRPLAPPHTGRNYLLDEMVFRVGRRRAAALRRLTLGAAILIPAGLVVLGAATGLAELAGGLACISHLAGVAAGRWLFFAEAEHSVGLYYEA
ncbi:MAG: DmsC/YnfH family molybdoenzyme membrane anchor subunit [Pseudomonadota bacterium]